MSIDTPDKFKPRVISGTPADYLTNHTPTIVPISHEPTDVEAVAGWLSLLRYGDMKTVAAGILGDGAKPEDVSALADKIHHWSEKAKLR